MLTEWVHIFPNCKLELDRQINAILSISTPDCGKASIKILLMI